MPFAMRNPIVVATLLLSMAVIDSAMPPQAGNPAGMWKGMGTRASNTYNLLQPPDEDLKAAIEQFYADGAAAPVPYSNLITATQRASLASEAWLGAYIFTPMVRTKLAAYGARSKSTKKPSLAEMKFLSGTLVVTFAFVTPQKGRLPGVSLLEGGATDLAEEMGPPKERMERCFGPQNAACYNYTQSVIFKYPESKKLRGVGTLVFHWADGEKRVAVNFDYLR